MGVASGIALTLSNRHSACRYTNISMRRKGETLHGFVESQGAKVGDAVGELAGGNDAPEFKLPLRSLCS